MIPTHECVQLTDFIPFKVLHIISNDTCVSINICQHSFHALLIGGVEVRYMYGVSIILHCLCRKPPSKEDSKEVLYHTGSDRHLYLSLFWVKSLCEQVERGGVLVLFGFHEYNLPLKFCYPDNCLDAMDWFGTSYLDVYLRAPYHQSISSGWLALSSKVRDFSNMTSFLSSSNHPNMSRLTKKISR